MKIALIGYGKMGRFIEEIAISRGHEIVARIDVDNASDIEGEAFASADVAIEFSAPQAACENVRKAFAAGVKVVSGTTGWFRQNEEEMRRLCENGNTLFWASNFSIGVAMFSIINRQLARMMNRVPEYAVSMEEVHHVHKLDAPSGTAITLAEAIEEEISRVDKVKIESIREGEVPGIHTITYESDVDRIIITHDAKSRRGFAFGAVLAAEYTKEHTGLLSMQDFTKEMFV